MARLNSRRLITLVLVVAATTLAYLLYYYWTPVPTQLSGSFLGGAENDTRTIKEVWPVRIIQPSWLPQTDELLSRWEIAEMRAREIAVALLWLCIVSIVILRDPSFERTKRPNQTLQPTAGRSDD
jgi:hypothetical protein